MRWLKYWGAKALYPILATAAITLVLFCGYGTVHGLVAGGFSSDAAAWAQAGGTVAAIVCAVWMSRAENIGNRRRRRREREEVAWSARFAIVAARNEVHTVVHELFDPTVAAKFEGGRHWRTRLRNARMLLLAYASRTDHIHPAFLQVTNNAILLLDEMEVDIELAKPLLVKGQPLPPELAETLSWYEFNFDTILDEIDSRMDGIRQALDDGGDMLPVESWLMKSRAHRARSAAGEAASS